MKGKVVLLGFWATWGLPCREEIPNLLNYYSEFNKKGLDIIGLTNENFSKNLSDYLKANKIKWSIITIDKGSCKEIATL